MKKTNSKNDHNNNDSVVTLVMNPQIVRLMRKTARANGITVSDLVDGVVRIACGYKMQNAPNLPKDIARCVKEGTMGIRATPTKFAFKNPLSSDEVKHFVNAMRETDQ